MNRELFDFIKYSPDDGAGGGEDLILDGVFETEGLQEEELFFLEGDPNIPNVEEEEIEDSPEIKALKNQNALLQQQMVGLQGQADSTAALTKGLENLGQNFRQPAQQAPAPSVDPAVAAKTFNDEFFNDPSEHLNEFARAKIEPALQQMMLTNANLSKQLLLIDPERAETYKKYTKEIDEVFNLLPIAKKIQNPAAAAQEAADIVASKHMPETMASMKEQLRAEIMAELKETSIEINSNQPVLHSESGINKRGPKQKGKSFVLPKGVWEYAGIMGLQGRGEKTDQARVYQSWKEGKLAGSGIEYK